METVPKSVIKLIKSLQLKKYRLTENRFLVEGRKSVDELLSSDLEVELIVVADYVYGGEARPDLQVFSTSPAKLSGMGSLTTNNSVIAVARIPEISPPDLTGLTLVLDGIRDPGNFGTILRIADWFGIRTILASEDCVDTFNPKVIQASKGSFLRVSVNYLELELVLREFPGTKIASDMKGEDARHIEFSLPALLVMGNESHGIRPGVRSLCNRVVSIRGGSNTESLNVGVATGILLSHMARY